MRSDSWTRERVELLTKLWREGCTAVAIAARLGGVSRSAVLGKIFRLRLGAATAQPAAPVGADAEAAKQKYRQATAAPSSNELPGSLASQCGVGLLRRRRSGKRAIPTQPPPPPARSQHKTLLELTNDSCRWPHGRSGARNFFFCGAPGADLENGIPYCAQHMRRAYVAPEQSNAEVQRAAAARRIFAFANASRKNGGDRLDR